jgi:hypothetical protein
MANGWGVKERGQLHVLEWINRGQTTFSERFLNVVCPHLSLGVVCGDPSGSVPIHLFLFLHMKLRNKLNNHLTIRFIFSKPLKNRNQIIAKQFNS